jgi:aspartyl protease family protein
MSGYTMLRETHAHQTPRALWLLCAALIAIIVLPPFGTLRHDSVEWVKAQIDWFDNPSVASPLPPPQTALPPSGSEAPYAEPPRLTVKVDRENRCHVKLMLDGKGPETFIVDTGAQGVVLTAAQGRRIGFDPAHTKADHDSGGWGGGTTDGIFRRIDLKLNDFTLRDFEVAIENETSFEEGLLGVSFIKKLKRFEVANGRCAFWW